MNGSREEILARIRSAVDGADVPDPLVRDYRTRGVLDVDGRVALLRDRLVDYRARVVEVGESEVGAVIGEIVGDGRIGVPPGLPDAWRPAGSVEDHGLSPTELDGLDGVLTGCTVAIADTGTLVLSSAEREGRRALTLVPDLHVCVVFSDQVVETVPEAFARLAGRERHALTFVSGPSATSDIELSRVEGVHGPRRLVVVIVSPGGGTG